MTFELHVWPGQWSLPSWDPTCLAAIMFLQLVKPGGFEIVEDMDPDATTAGQFPALKHDEELVSGLSPIVRHVLSQSDPGNNLFPTVKAQTAWITYVESALGDLVANTFYAVEDNWRELTQPTLAKSFTFPQRLYSPNRIRETFKSRLEAADLWIPRGVQPDEEGPKKPDFRNPRPKTEKEGQPLHKYYRAFAREKVSEKAQSVFQMINRLLGDSQFFGGNRPALLDIVVSAHILLVLIPPFPDPFIRDILNSSFPNLVLHANRMRHITALQPPNLTIRKSGSQSVSNEVWRTRLCYGFFGIGIGGAIAYTIFSK